MSEERDIEKQLRAFAEQRRQEAGTPFELHPATRRLWQGEVARVRGGGDSRPAGSWLRRVVFGQWPRLAWASSVLAILAAGTWLYVSVPTKSPQLAASMEKTGVIGNDAAPSGPVAELAYTRQAGKDTADRPTAKEAYLVTRRVEGGVDDAMAVAAVPNIPPATSLPAETPAPAPESSAIVDKGVALAMDRQRGDEHAAGAPPAGVPATEFAQLLDASAAQQNYHFRNDPVTDAKAGGMKPAAAKLAKADASGGKKAEVLLANFQLEQIGEQIRIIDGDGSVYTGSLMVAEAEVAAQPPARVMGVLPAVSAPAGEFREKRQARIMKEPPRSSAALANQAASQNYRFAAHGLNRSLQQKVTITGEMLNAGSLTAAATNVPGAQDNAQRQTQQLLRNSLWLSNGRIVGRAVTADGREVELNATQVLP